MYKRQPLKMLTIRRAVETDCGLIRSLADEVFPATYREIITSSQMDYMMKWMYAPEVLRREMRTGVAWFIASSDGEPCGYLSVQQEMCIRDRCIAKKVTI